MRYSGAINRHHRPIALLFAVVIAIVFTSGCGKNPVQQSQKYIDQARGLLEQGKVNEAVLMYRRAIQANPRSASAHVELSKIYSRRREFLPAYKELLLAVEAEPKNIDARLRKAEFLIMARNFEAAKQDADEVLKIRPGDATAQIILAQSAMGLKDLALASNTVASLLKAEPHNAQALVLRSAVEAQQNEGEKSEATLREAIQADPAWSVPYGMLAARLSARKDEAAAEAVLQQGLRSNPTSIAANEFLASYMLFRRRVPEAEDLYSRIKQLAPNDPELRTLLGQLYQTLGKYDLAEKEYREIIQAHPSDDLSRRLLAGLNLSMGKLAEAEQQLNAILKDTPTQSEALAMRGTARIQQLRVEEGVVDLQRSLQISPDNAKAHFYLAQGYLRQGNVTRAKSELVAAKDLRPDMLGPALQLAALELSTGESGRALAITETVLKANPSTPVPHWLKSAALSARGDLAGAERELTPLVDEFQGQGAQALTYRALAFIKLNQKKPAEARKMAEKALALDPSLESIYLVGRTYIAENKPDAAFKAVEAILAKNSQLPAGYEALGALQMENGRLVEAEASLQKAVALAPQRVSAKLKLAEALTQEQKWDAATNVLIQLGKDEPKLAIPPLMLGRLYETRHDTKQAVSNYEQALKIAPDNIVAKNNLAYLYAETGGNIDVALRMAQEAREAAPEDPSIADTLGWIYCKKEIFGNAIHLLQESVKKQPQNATMYYHLGYAYSQQGMKKEARESLLTALRLQPDFSNAAQARELLNKLN